MQGLGTVRGPHVDVSGEAGNRLTISTTRSRNNINTVLIDTFNCTATDWAAWRR